jgi:hypothetical protein
MPETLCLKKKNDHVTLTYDQPMTKNVQILKNFLLRKKSNTESVARQDEQIGYQD